MRESGECKVRKQTIAPVFLTIRIKQSTKYPRLKIIKLTSYKISIIAIMTTTREVVLITGANTGIGFEIVKALCKSDEPYDIIVSGRSLEKVERAISDATTEFPASRSKLYPLQVDIEYDDSIKKAFEEVISKFGRVDALINNAGMLSHEQSNLSPQADRFNDRWLI